MVSALDISCGQTYCENQYRMLGVHMQRVMFVFFNNGNIDKIRCNRNGHYMVVFFLFHAHLMREGYANSKKLGLDIEEEGLVFFKDEYLI
jgi:hypothetical protein